MYFTHRTVASTTVGGNQGVSEENHTTICWLLQTFRLTDSQVADLLRLNISSNPFMPMTQGLPAPQNSRHLDGQSRVNFG